jgi:hypothetical protein
MKAANINIVVSSLSYQPKHPDPLLDLRKSSSSLWVIIGNKSIINKGISEHSRIIKSIGRVLFIFTEIIFFFVIQIAFKLSIDASNRLQTTTLDAVAHGRGRRYHFIAYFSFLFFLTLFVHLDLNF